MRQAGSIVRKRKRYYIVYRTPAKQQRWEGGFDTKGKAQERLTEVLSSMHTGAYFKPTETTFKEFAEKWLENRVSLAGSTYEAYKILLGRHAMPLLGHLKLREIDSGVIQHLIAELCRKSSVNNPTKRLSANTVRKTSTLLGQVFQSAVKAKLIHTNPARNLDDLPKLGRPNIQFPEKEDVLEILKQAPAESRLFFLLDAMTGLRRGELLALQWRDIDWLQSEVAVERSISKQKGSDGAHKYQWAVGPTKTGQVRTVGIPSTALAALQALRTTSEQQQEEDFIFTRNGTFISPQHFTRSISSPLLKAAIQGRVGGLHRLRHFFASMLIAQGESPKYVQDQLGHKSITTTFDIYGHVMGKAKKEATAKLEASLLGSQGDVRTLLERPSSDDNEQTIN